MKKLLDAHVTVVAFRFAALIDDITLKVSECERRKALFIGCTTLISGNLVCK